MFIQRKAQVGQLVPIPAGSQVKAVYTALTSDYNGQLLSEVEIQQIIAEKGLVIKEPNKDWQLWHDGRLGYFSLIPRRTDEVAIFIELDSELKQLKGANNYHAQKR